MLCPNCQKDVPPGSNFCCSCGARQPDAATPNYSAPPSPPYAAPTRRRIVRSINDRKIAGVCAGVAEYFDLDPLLVRIVWLLLLLCAGTGALAYIVCWVLFPEGYTGYVQTQPGVPAR
jgi:phage shock protein PspC (stress-responsive transcriptional regulator)